MHYGSSRVLPVLYIHGSEMKMEVQGQAEMLLVVPQLIQMGQFQYFIAIPCMYAIVIMLLGKVLSEQ